MQGERQDSKPGFAILVSLTLGFGVGLNWLNT
jgi:hypothetical protein